MKNRNLMMLVAFLTVIMLALYGWSNSNSLDKSPKGSNDHGTKSIRHLDLDHNESEEIVESEEQHEHHEGLGHFSKSELDEFGIGLEKAKSGVLEQYTALPGEIILNADLIAHVVPRVGGIVQDVLVTEGDQVQAGQLLAVIESRELAEAKAAYLAALERVSLAEASYKREKRLWEKRVTSEQDYLDATQAWVNAKIERNSTKQQLHALGVPDQILSTLPNDTNSTYTRFEILAPQNGTIIEKHITHGEFLNGSADVFTIADLSTVWVDLDVYQKDLASVVKGQQVMIEVGSVVSLATGTIAWVSPQVDEGTRTARARMVLDNHEGQFRPGLFVTARVMSNQVPCQVLVQKNAIQTLHGKTVIFVLEDGTFEPIQVTLGRENAEWVEILAGLLEGQTYVKQGAFTLKAQLSKQSFGDGHQH